jgi:hypothetical protein
VFLEGVDFRSVPAVPHLFEDGFARADLAGMFEGVAHQQRQQFHLVQRQIDPAAAPVGFAQERVQRQARRALSGITNDEEAGGASGQRPDARLQFPVPVRLKEQVVRTGLETAVRHVVGPTRRDSQDRYRGQSPAERRAPVGFHWTIAIALEPVAVEHDDGAG